MVSFFAMEKGDMPMAYLGPDGVRSTVFLPSAGVATWAFSGTSAMSRVWPSIQALAPIEMSLSTLMQGPNRTFWPIWTRSPNQFSAPNDTLFSTFELLPMRRLPPIRVPRGSGHLTANDEMVAPSVRMSPEPNVNPLPIRTSCMIVSAPSKRVWEAMDTSPCRTVPGFRRLSGVMAQTRTWAPLATVTPAGMITPSAIIGSAVGVVGVVGVVDVVTIGMSGAGATMVAAPESIHVHVFVLPTGLPECATAGVSLSARLHVVRHRSNSLRQFCSSLLRNRFCPAP